MLAHLEVLWGLCWGQVRPSRAMLGIWLCFFLDVTLFPNFALKSSPQWPASRMSELFIEDLPVFDLSQWPASFTFRAFSLPPLQWPASPLEVNFGLRRAVSPKSCFCVDGRCECPLNGPILGPCWGYVGSSGSMLGPGSPISGLGTGRRPMSA